MRYLLYTIIFINIVILYLYLLSPVSIKELFSNNPLIVYNVELNNKNIKILFNNFDKNYYLKDLLDNVKNINFINESSLDYSNLLIYTDIFTYMFNYPELKVLSVLNNEEKVLFFIKPKDEKKTETLQDIIESNLTIGYVNEIDKLLIQFLAISMGIEKHLILKLLRKITIPLEKEIDSDFYIKNNIHSLLLFIPLSNSDIIPNKFSESFKADFIQYDNFDIDKLKFFVPYCKTKNVDMTLYFKGRFTSTYPIKSCLAFDTLLCGSYKLENDEDLYYELTKIIVKIGNYDLINYYTMYVQFFKQTMVYIDSMNKHIQTRDSLPILEQFIDNANTNVNTNANTNTKDSSNKPIYTDYTIDIDVHENINGYYNAINKTFEIKILKINNIPIILYSHIKLNAQDREEENGTYIVQTKENNVFILKKNLVFNGYTIDDMGFVSLDGIDNIDGVNINFIKEVDLIYIAPLKLYGRITKDRKSLKTYEPSKSENPSDDSRYECYEQQQIKSKGLCESAYDSIGKPKDTKMYWDRRCEQNIDCPFYQANKNYKNYFGGCIDGFCQMPLGINRVSYRKYDTESKAICYNCKDISNPFCCEEQKDSIKYPNLVSPDYAFPLDSYNRMKQLTEKPIKWFNIN